jgi:Ser/Thr protein kinase RdoA (MazF antagonist)
VPEAEPPPIPWTVDEVRAFLAAYGYAPRRLAVEQLESWWCNLVLRVEAGGEQLILRRYGLTPPEEVRWELAVLAHLRAHDFPTIAPLTRPDGDALGTFGGKPAILYPYVEGHNACQPGVDRWHAMGETAALVARLHDLTVGVTLPYPRVQSGSNSRRVLDEFLRFVRERGVAAHEPALARLVADVEQAIGEFDARFAPRAGDLPCGVVHHDAHCANVLFQGERLVALIDFDDAYEGAVVADLPRMIYNWAHDYERQALRPERAAHIVRTYEHHRRLAEAERDLLPDYLALFALSDGIVSVQLEIERGAPADDAIAASNVYPRYHEYRHYPHPPAGDWRDALRRTLLGE